MKPDLPAVVLSGLLATACAHYPVNAPLTRYEPAAGYRFDNLPPGEGNTDAVMLCLAFSGGGTRAAALAYGVLQELRDTEITEEGGPRRLLQEVDCISAVSGGSMAAAYYALFRDKIFTSFEPDLLRRDIEEELVKKALVPSNWFRLASPDFSRVDLAAELYDTTIFQARRYKDLLAGTRPFVILNATNIALGSRFELTQDQFDFLGSDLGEYPVARAVAASSAFPVLLNPISLRNYPNPSGFSIPEAVRNAMEDAVINPRRYLWAKDLVAYQDKAARPYLHVLDGGLADNLGLRAISDAYTRGFIRRRINGGSIKDLVVIVVNAKTTPPETTDESETPPRVVDVLMKTMTVSMDNYSFETVELMRALLDESSHAQECVEACRRYANAHCTGAPPLPELKKVRVHVIEINFDQLSDPAEKELFLGLPTRFRLKNHEVDCLIAAGRKLLRQSLEYQALLGDLGGRLLSDAEPAATFPKEGCRATQ